ncbi:MAG: phBC6A51 family helix-turn-helix protein [Methanobacterium sp.]
MAVQKKKKTTSKKTPKSPIFKWTPQRKRAALLLSEGTYNYDEVATLAGVNKKTLYDWRQSDIFLNEVDRLTLENERATKAGLLRLALKAIKDKEEKIKEDKNTALDWAEFVSDIQGMKTQKHEVNANFKMELEGARELLESTIAGIASRLRTEEVLEQTEQSAGNSSEI